MSDKSGHPPVPEAFAALGYQTWVSTFCPFFDWKVLRRTAVGHQERLEAMAAADGWLSEGHGLDLTMLATASNLETRTNGATHMANDDALVFDAIAHLKIIDVSCPRQMLSIMKWSSAQPGAVRRPEPGFWLGVIWDLDCLRLSSSWTPTSLCRMRS